MRADVANKPEKGMPHRIFRGKPMNVSEMYYDKKEYLNTYPDLLVLDNKAETPCEK